MVQPSQPVPLLIVVMAPVPPSGVPQHIEYRPQQSVNRHAELGHHDVGKKDIMLANGAPEAAKRAALSERLDSVTFDVQEADEDDDGRPCSDVLEQPEV